MKDAKGHGSDSRGGTELQQAATNFQAARQTGVNQAAPSQSGRDLYAAAMEAAQRAHPHEDHSDIAGMAPDFDEYGDFKQESVLHPGKMYRG